MGGGQVKNCKPLDGTNGCFVSGTENPDPEKCQTFATKEGEIGFFCADEKSASLSPDSPKGPSVPKSAEKFKGTPVIKPGMSAEEIKKAADAAVSGDGSQVSAEDSEDQELLDNLQNTNLGLGAGFFILGIPGMIIGTILGYNFGSISEWISEDSEDVLAADKPEADPAAKKPEGDQPEVKPDAGVAEDAETEEVNDDAESSHENEITVRVNWPKDSPFVNESDALSAMGKFLWFSSLKPEAQQMYKAGSIVVAQKKAQENPGANSVKITVREIENELKEQTEFGLVLAGFPHELPKPKPQDDPTAAGQEGAASKRKVAKSGGGKSTSGSGKTKKTGGKKPASDGLAF
ncbi:MAG: hypothetical protein WC683_06455 [bacterium]